MKWLAALLVIVNVGYFAWNHWLLDPLRTAPPTLPAEAAESIDRLEEVDLNNFAKREPASLGTSGGRAIEASCFAVGPLAGEYSEGSVMGRVREWLKSRGGRIGLRTGKYHELSYYWVYLPPAGTHDTAEERVRELAANAFGGAVVIPEGNMKNAVSIGVYGLRTALERDLTRLKAQGFEPEVQRVRRTGESLWFTANFPAGYEFPEKRFSVAFAGLEAVDTRCPPPRAPAAAEAEAEPPSRDAEPQAEPRQLAFGVPPPVEEAREGGAE
ncbi:MAG: hypothetical protein OXC01_19910 [Immundisolibacterales bacterium]|nr:hypothetical protein [Immundisolibacterales bacterium]